MESSKDAIFGFHLPVSTDGIASARICAMKTTALLSLPELIKAFPFLIRLYQVCWKLVIFGFRFNYLNLLCVA
ncbi:hypothetical protein SDJN02_01648 [Cucurbita argyrosperma subsp. argyrosperma]|nr:hypothetical protein SDJN02_01648 [Cucurbita argyrosperma subsp. argyrosperma]